MITGFIRLLKRVSVRCICFVISKIWRKQNSLLWKFARKMKLSRSDYILWSKQTKRKLNGMRKNEKICLAEEMQRKTYAPSLLCYNTNVDLMVLYSLSRNGPFWCRVGLNSIQPVRNHGKANLGKKHGEKKILIWKSSKYLLYWKKGHFLLLMAICTGEGKQGAGVISAQLSALLA